MPDLKPFQRAGAQFLAARTRALLADEPGVGKTAQVVAACDLVGARRVRVVCPAVGVTHWRREFDKWSVTPRRLEVLGYEQARSIYTRGEAISPVDVFVPDECHFAKNVGAARAKAIYGKDGFGWHAGRIWALSGTPAPNHAGELWPMLAAFGKTKMTHGDFVNYFCRVDGLGKIRGTRADHISELRAILNEFTLRRKKADVLPELGAIDIQEWHVDPRDDYVSLLINGPALDGSDAKARAAEGLEQLEAQIAGQSGDELARTLEQMRGRRDDSLAMLRQVNAMRKTPAVYEQVMFEIENGLTDKVVIYAYHRVPMQLLRRMFNDAGVGAELIYGETPQRKRDHFIQRWKRPSGPKVMLASIIAAGVVLDFTEAHQGIMLEMDWVPGNNVQAMQRMHRHGQTRPVTVRVAMADGIDERINTVLANKARELAAIFD